MIICTLQTCITYFQKLLLIVEDPVIDRLLGQSKIILNPGEQIKREVQQE
jgi:hypothetical protein